MAKDIKPHIGIFGRRNNGKSSFINLLVGQDVAIVSDHAGTTTDPVKKSVEIFGIGPRITSYNVCYTKLLRSFRVAAFHVFHILSGRISECHATSYEVHNPNFS